MCWYITCPYAFLSFWDTHNRSCIDWHVIKMFCSCSCLRPISNAENPFEWSSMILVRTSTLSLTIVKSFLYGHGTLHTRKCTQLHMLLRFHFIEALINMLMMKLRYNRETRDTYSEKTQTRHVLQFNLVESRVLEIQANNASLEFRRSACKTPGHTRGRVSHECQV